MKKLIIAAAALLVSIAAYGQGQLVINNRVPPDINARFILAGVDPAAATSSSIGTDYGVQLLGGPVGGTLVALDPASTTFRGAAGTAAAGYFNGVTATVPGVAAGANASILLRVTGPGLGAGQDFGPYPVTLGGGVNPPPNLALGTTPLSVVPEPATLALGALGVGALLMIRRRK